MNWTSVQGVADERVLHLSTIGRKTGLLREIEIWFVVCCERLYLFAETGEAAGWVKNIRRNPEVAVRIGERQTRAAARVSIVTPTGSYGTKLPGSLIANMDGAMGCRWRLPRFRARGSKSE